MVHPTGSPWHDRLVGEREALLSLWRERYAEPTSGWDFSAFDAVVDRRASVVVRRPRAGGPDRRRVGARHRTGGGEVLLTLADALPADTVATEGWPPNLPVATAALAPHGIEVVAYDSETDARMPFDDERFDVVLDRHESYVASEVFRVLSPGGVFLTQQVDGRDFEETPPALRRLAGVPARHAATTCAPRPRRPASRWRPAEEWVGAMRFADVAAFVSYVRMVPWEVPEDFSVDRYADVLLRLTADDLVFTQRRFVLVCRRPGR